MDYVDGQFGPCKPIAVEQTASGYQVAWKVEGADQYTIWTTDSNGNYLSDNGALTGNSATLKSFETSFHQDLNGDGVIGLATTGSLANAGPALAEAPVDTSNTFNFSDGLGSPAVTDLQRSEGGAIRL